MAELIGIGLYTPIEAASLLGVPRAKIARWLRGHRMKGREYPPLWSPQVDLGDGHLYLGFRDLMEVRVANQFIKLGISPQRVRAAIEIAREFIGEDRPLSTDRFRTDGRTIFMKTVDPGDDGQEREHLVELFKRQYAFKEIIDPLLKPIDFDEQGNPAQWWPVGRRGRIVVDPRRSFGQPIDATSGVPTAVLANASHVEGFERTARAYDVAPGAVRRAAQFEGSRRAAA